MLEALQGIGLELVALVAAVIAGLTVLDDTIASFVRRVPVVGPILAPILRRLSARFRAWMRDSVAKSAEAAVMEAEGELGHVPGTGSIKRSQAIETLDRREPGLADAELQREIDAAFRRLIGADRLELHDAPANVKHPATLDLEAGPGGAR